VKTAEPEGRARPTLRCLTSDLGLAIPPVEEPLDEIDHPLLAKAREQFADTAAPHERIRAVDDAVLVKIKVQRWRGAVWTGDQPLPWVVAAGTREEGSPDDFYQALTTQAEQARARYNAEHPKPIGGSTYVGHLLPGTDDVKRHRIESGARLRRNLDAFVRELTSASLRDGREHSADLDTFTLGIQVRADDAHATYAAVRITGSAPENIVMVILARVPGCDRDTWAFDMRMPDRALIGNEQVWSTLMDPKAAALLLNENDTVS
jgi:hypothetical protein